MKIGGRGLLNNVYHGSLLHLLCAVYPEYEWLPWRFTQVPKAYWNDINNQKIFLEWAEKQLNIKEKEDWYKITRKVLFQ